MHASKVKRVAFGAVQDLLRGLMVSAGGPYTMAVSEA